MKKSLNTGITGQDGSYLVVFLLHKRYEVHGIVRRSSIFNKKRIDHLYRDPHLPNTRFFLYYGELCDSGQLTDIIYNIKPDEIYYLGAAPPPPNENTPFHPRSPYAASKVYSYWMVKNYREGYNIFACSGILFNHESPRRGESFVTRKITVGIAEILAGKKMKIYLGSLDAKRDWGYAPEYVEAMWLMLQQDKPDDYVIGTGETHSVKEFMEGVLSIMIVADHSILQKQKRSLDLSRKQVLKMD